jgi:hypothetical protein
LLHLIPGHRAQAEAPVFLLTARRFAAADTLLDDQLRIQQLDLLKLAHHRILLRTLDTSHTDVVECQEARKHQERASGFSVSIPSRLLSVRLEE